MPSFQDSIFLFILALLLFGPKRLPTLAREVGKWLAEFRRASNEFKMQMEDELRASEHAEQQKKIAAMEAAAPPPAALPAGDIEVPSYAMAVAAEEQMQPPLAAEGIVGDDHRPASPPHLQPPPVAYDEPAPLTTPVEPLPIAEAGEFRMMPPSTGLPRARARDGSEPRPATGSALGGLIDSIPETAGPDATPQEAEHGS